MPRHVVATLLISTCSFSKKKTPKSSSNCTDVFSDLWLHSIFTGVFVNHYIYFLIVLKSGFQYSKNILLRYIRCICISLFYDFELIFHYQVILLDIIRAPNFKLIQEGAWIIQSHVACAFQTQNPFVHAKLVRDHQKIQVTSYKRHSVSCCTCGCGLPSSLLLKYFTFNFQFSIIVLLLSFPIRMLP